MFRERVAIAGYVRKTLLFRTFTKMPTAFELIDPVKGISCHAWNKDKTMCAVCPNDNTMIIYGEAGQILPREPRGLCADCCLIVVAV